MCHGNQCTSFVVDQTEPVLISRQTKDHKEVIHHPLRLEHGDPSRGSHQKRRPKRQKYQNQKQV